jgi:IS30 family transposase
MSKNYNQLSLEQRYMIEALVKVRMNQNVIAAQLDVSPSTISRELKRNTLLGGMDYGKYIAIKAQQRTDRRHEKKRKRILFTESMKGTIVEQLNEEKWSPKLISHMGRISCGSFISHEWIYQWIWKCKHTDWAGNKKYKKLYELLKHGRMRRKRGKRKENRGALLANRVPIEQRPPIVARRKRTGDIEVDLMMGNSNRGAVLVMTDRATLHTRLKKLPGKNSDKVGKAIIQCLNENQYSAHTLTFDNDRAFCCHEMIARTKNVDTYFTRPYTSQDKGTVENRIGVIRRFLPKKTDLRLITEKEIKIVEQKINNRPVRKFNYLTPNQVLLKKIALIT